MPISYVRLGGQWVSRHTLDKLCKKTWDFQWSSLSLWHKLKGWYQIRTSSKIDAYMRSLRCIVTQFPSSPELQLAPLVRLAARFKICIQNDGKEWKIIYVIHNTMKQGWPGPQLQEQGGGGRWQLRCTARELGKRLPWCLWKLSLRWRSDCDPQTCLTAPSQHTHLCTAAKSQSSLSFLHPSKAKLNLQNTVQMCLKCPVEMGCGMRDTLLHWPNSRHATYLKF